MKRRDMFALLWMGIGICNFGLVLLWQPPYNVIMMLDMLTPTLQVYWKILAVHFTNRFFYFFILF